MKKINILLFLSLCYFVSQAQISFTRTDMPSIGWTNPEQKDTTRNRVAAISFGSRGTNQTYNFSSLVRQAPDSVSYLALTSSQHSAVPNANVALFLQPTTYLFGVDTTTNFSITGLQATLFNTVVTSKYTTPDTNYKFPLVYGQNFHGNYSGSVKLLASTVSSSTSFLGWDSIMVVVNAGYTDTIDGWGTVKTPVGTYNCLRQKRVEHDTTIYYYNSTANGPYTQMPTVVNVLGTNYTILAANPAYGVTTSYAYLAKEAKGAVISFSYDSVSDPITATWSSLPPYPVAKFTADTGAGGLVTFLDSSSNGTTYSWSFGDGSGLNSSVAPTHTYSTNGAYNVCLTVTNTSGTSTICDSVHITNIHAGTPPVAQITPAGHDTICPGSSVILRAQTGTSYTFKWSTGATADSIIVSTGGSYTVTVHNATDSATSPTTVVVVATPNTTLTLNGPASFCTGDSTQISAAAGQTYHWSTGAATQSIWVSTNGSYTVTVTNSNQCSAPSSPQSITVHTPSTDNITNSGAVLTSQAETHYQWYEGSTLLAGDTSMTLTAISSGSYSVHFVDANGCSGVSNSKSIIAGIIEISPADYRIYPNPASEQIQLDLSHVDKTILNSLSEIVIYNLLGEKVKTLPISQTTISVKDLNNGTYLIGVMDKNQSKKILGKFDVLK